MFNRKKIKIRSKPFRPVICVYSDSLSKEAGNAVGTFLMQGDTFPQDYNVELWVSNGNFSVEWYILWGDQQKTCRRGKLWPSDGNRPTAYQDGEPPIVYGFAYSIEEAKKEAQEWANRILAFTLDDVRVLPQGEEALLETFKGS